MSNADSGEGTKTRKASTNGGENTKIASGAGTFGPRTQLGSLPTVTVAIVAHNPGAWFSEVIESVKAQDYPALDLMVIDAACDQPIAEQVHAIFPEASVVPLSVNAGYAKNANVLLQAENLGQFLLICHDDVALSSDCVRRLAEEAVRSNAGIVGPKLLDWDNSRRILHVGMQADKLGVTADIAEPGEYDQEQYDRVKDVFAVPGAATLIRTDLFKALGGFDDSMLVHGEDLDICWRAHVLGARVVINPAASVRHREDLDSRIAGHRKGRFQQRHQLRAMLSNYGLWHTIRILPQAALAALVAMIVALANGRLADISTIFASWTWNFARLPSVLKRRSALAKLRQVPDSEVRQMQMGGFAAFDQWRRRRAEGRAQDFGDTSASQIQQQLKNKRRWDQITAMIGFSVAVVLIFGSRQLLAGGLPVFNEFASFPNGPAAFLAEWGTTWRSTGIGAEAPSSPLYLVLGFASIGLFGATEILRLLVTLGAIFVGIFGMYRALAPFDSRQGQLVGMALYAAAPVPYNALAAGSWSGLVTYALLPWIAYRLATAASIRPFGEEETRLIRRLADIAQAAILIAIGMWVTPMVPYAVAILVLGWFVGSLASGALEGNLRLLGSTLGAFVIAAVLNAPSLIESASGKYFVSLNFGGADTVRTQHEVLKLLRLVAGPNGDSLISWSLLVVPAIALLLASGYRFGWAARSWVALVFAVAVAWLTSTGIVEIQHSDTHSLLVPGAVALAAASAMAFMAFERDLRKYRFGWRQFVPIIAATSLLVSAFGGVGGAIGGRWEVAEGGYDSVLSFLDDQAPAHSRAFWLGDDSVLPVQGWDFDGDLEWSITQARLPSILDREIGSPDSQAEDVADVVFETVHGNSNRLGRKLALYGIRYLIVVESNAPEPFGTLSSPVDEFVKQRLAEQLDLARVELRGGATVYRNQAYVPMVAQFGQGTVVDGDEVVRRGVISAPFDIALREARSLRSYRGPLASGDLYTALPHEASWTASVDGTNLEKQPVFDWASVYRVPGNGTVTLEYQNNSTWVAYTVGQIVVWAVLIVLLILGRRRK